MSFCKIYKSKVFIDECFELEGDYQNLFLGKEVFPEPKYKRLNLSKRTVNKIHYDDVYILEPLHYYYVTLTKKSFYDKDSFRIKDIFYRNGLIIQIDADKIYLFNSSQNIIHLQKGTEIGYNYYVSKKFTKKG